MGRDDFAARVHGSGRTDSGVHAIGQVAHFDAPPDFSLRGPSWREALNTKLPREIRVLEAAEVEDDFHARFSATGKCYRYRLFRGRNLSPLELGRAWNPRGRIDRGLLEAAAQALIGEHDFGAFAASRGAEHLEPASTVRTITGTRIIEEDDADGVGEGPVIRLEFSGDGFLYKMVRLLTGYVVQIATGALTIDDLRAALSNPKGGTTGHCAPPDGLYLLRVDYPATVTGTDEPGRPIASPA